MQEKQRFAAQHKPVSHNDLATCQQLLEAHQRYVMYGDKVDSMDENSSYPLGHSPYGPSASGSKGANSAPAKAPDKHDKNDKAVHKGSISKHSSSRD